MRIILVATAVAIVLAIGAAFVLDRQQITATDAFQTPGVRLDQSSLGVMTLR